MPDAQLPPPPVSTAPALADARQQHQQATPRHQRIVRRADRVLDMFEEYKAESDYLRGER